MICINVEKKIVLFKKRKIINLKILIWKNVLEVIFLEFDKNRINMSYWCNKNKENKEVNEWFFFIYLRYFLK